MSSPRGLSHSGACRKFYFVPGIHQALKQVSEAVNAIVPDRAEWDRRFEEIKAGRAANAVRKLEPFSSRREDVAPYCRYSGNNFERMRYDRYRDQNIQVGSGVVQRGCRMLGFRLKRPGTRCWSERGANAMLALKSCVMNLRRVPDFLDWQARRAVGAGTTTPGYTRREVTARPGAS